MTKICFLPLIFIVGLSWAEPSSVIQVSSQSAPQATPLVPLKDSQVDSLVKRDTLPPPAPPKSTWTVTQIQSDFYRIAWNVPENIPSQIVVMDGIGNVVHSLWKSNSVKGKQMLFWKGLDKNKKPIANGKYILQLTTSRDTLQKIIQLKHQ
jgi:hypothetical protein